MEIRPYSVLEQYAILYPAVYQKKIKAPVATANSYQGEDRQEEQPTGGRDHIIARPPLKSKEK
jgi:hypothetical protein